jgi:hypothetical protein
MLLFGLGTKESTRFYGLGVAERILLILGRGLNTNHGISGMTTNCLRPGQLIGGRKNIELELEAVYHWILTYYKRASAGQASRASPKPTATETIKLGAYKEALAYMLSEPRFHQAWTFQEIAVVQKLSSVVVLMMRSSQCSHEG